MDTSGGMAYGPDVSRRTDPTESPTQPPHRARPAGPEWVFTGTASDEAWLDRVADTDLSILLEGETGTGKTELAQEIHRRSCRRGRPFVPVCLTSSAESLVASELAGHEQGAFTGAVRPRKGTLRAADGGTIFFDEIGDATPRLQESLLEVLERGRARPVGSDKQISFDVRIIAATNRDLPAMIRQGLFREDLYYRLTYAVIRMAPLHQREDFDRILRDSLAAVAAICHVETYSIDDEAVERLRAVHFEGNIRGLRQALARAFLDGVDGRIRPEDVASSPDCAPAMTSAPETMLDMKKRLVREALRVSKGNKTIAARILRISRCGLIKFCKAHGIS